LRQHRELTLGCNADHRILTKTVDKNWQCRHAAARFQLTVLQKVSKTREGQILTLVANFPDLGSAEGNSDFPPI